MEGKRRKHLACPVDHQNRAFVLLASSDTKGENMKDRKKQDGGLSEIYLLRADNGAWN